MPAAPNGTRVAGRVTYIRCRQGYEARVLADFLEDGREDFADQEWSETRWYPFEPSPRERDFAWRLLQSHSTDDQPHDSGSLRKAGLVFFEDERSPSPASNRSRTSYRTRPGSPPTIPSSSNSIRSRRSPK